jgi:hypothetical protein
VRQKPSAPCALYRRYDVASICEDKAIKKAESGGKQPQVPGMAENGEDKFAI